MKVNLATRLTLLNAFVMSLTSAGVLALVVMVTRHDMNSHVEESVMAELDVLVAEYRIDGMNGLRGLIAFREGFESVNHGRVYRVENASGTHLAGAWASWPQPLKLDGHIIRLPNPNRQPQTDWLMAASALPDGGRFLVGFDSIELHALMDDIYRAAVIGLMVAIALALGFGVLINRAALQPIATIRRSAETIIDGDLTHRIPNDSSGDEFGALTATLNRMLDRIDQLVIGIRGTTDAIAHDLRSPLTRHRARLEAALRNPPPTDRFEDWLHDTIEETDRVLGTFNALLQLATVEAGVAQAQFTNLVLNRVVLDAVSLYDADASERGMRILTTVPDADCTVRGDRHLLFQCIINLLDNALKYGPSGQTISILLRDEIHTAVIEVSDEGPGIPEPEDAFKRMVRGDTARQTAGHGLGLTLVRAVARLHGGDALILPTRRGATVRLALPATK